MHKARVTNEQNYNPVSNHLHVAMTSVADLGFVALGAPTISRGRREYQRGANFTNLVN